MEGTVIDESDKLSCPSGEESEIDHAMVRRSEINMRSRNVSGNNVEARMRQ